jgi:hypothetical protein
VTAERALELFHLPRVWTSSKQLAGVDPELRMADVSLADRVVYTLLLEIERICCCGEGAGIPLYTVGPLRFSDRWIWACTANIIASKRVIRG